MQQAWRRYANEPDILYALLYLLDREIERRVIETAWLLQEWSDINDHLANMQGV